eukprot:m.63685 g.63685  ORF g.63685 m.63685 type:complete len:548 (-) comp23325_c0_seq1:547-2190(-)
MAKLFFLSKSFVRSLRPGASTSFVATARHPSRARSYPFTFRSFSASMSSTPRGYEDAIVALNQLQTNASDLAAPVAVEKSLIHTREWAARIGLQGQDLNALKAIHVAGTKGKGSTCSMTEALLRTQGLKTGLFTSPHLIEARERIRINGAPISKEMFAKYFFNTWDALKQNASTSNLATMPPYFRFLTIMSFKVFLAEAVDVAVIEVGLGGTWDSTNIIDQPVVCGITSLGLDHCSVLGNTIEEIAAAKAGIFKSGVPAITVPQYDAAYGVLKQCATERETPLMLTPDFDKYECDVLDLKLGIAGVHQKVNASLALQLVKVWTLQNKKNVEEKTLPALQTAVDGLENLLPTFALTQAQTHALQNCRCPGRSQVEIYRGMTWYLDGAHTVESCAACSNWFNKVSSTQDSDVATTIKKVLIFNCTHARDPQPLLECFNNVDFDLAIFTIASNKSPNKNADQDNRTVTRIKTLECSQHCKHTYEEIQMKGADSKQSDSDSKQAEFIPHIEDVMSFLENSKAKHDGEVQVLVTGSLHLVGAFFSAMELPVR